MEIYYTKIIESLVVITIFILLRLIVNKLVNKTIADRLLQKSRSELVRRAINLITFTVAIIILMVIWGVEHSKLAVFLGSVLTVIGVAMFAQWSILSNITSSLVIFFNHFVKIGDKIAIMESKDYEVQGEVVSFDLFFVKLKSIDTEEEISLPNNIFIQKTIRKISEKGLDTIDENKEDEIQITAHANID
jgi:small-conductance mechanosensitive channel